MLPCVFSLKPEYRHYIWGGQRLIPGTQTAEAWMIYEGDFVASGPLAGMTLGEVVEQYGEGLLGKRAYQNHGRRFPLLIKLLDCNQWLSLQVHPNDEQAERLEGSGQTGKTEAWYVLEAKKDAQIIAGLKNNVGKDELSQAITNGNILDVVQYVNVKQGNTVYMPSGTIHSLGPGLFVYEVQQTSDITYRVYDWDRPQTSGRPLHIDKSLQVVNPEADCEVHSLPKQIYGDTLPLCQSEYFRLEKIHSTREIKLDTEMKTFHAMTVIEGSGEIKCADQVITLKKFDAFVVPAATGNYAIEPGSSGIGILKASI